MSERKISYTNRTYEDYKKSLMDNIKKYYPQIANDFDDASIGTWLIEMVASIADNLSFHIDRTYTETNIDSAQKTSSIYSIARSNGYKVPGAKGSMVEVEIGCELPVVTKMANDSSTVGMPNWYFAPVIKRGSRMTASNQIFELMNDVDFSQAFNEDGYLNRDITPVRNSNGDIVRYKVTKKEIAIAGESRIYKQEIYTEDIVPFMEILLPDTNVMGVESIIFKDGVNFTLNPSYSEFMMNSEFIPAEEIKTGVDTYRFFEVNSLVENYRWQEAITKEGNESENQNVSYRYGYFDDKSGVVVPTASITKGEWKPLTQKYITEFTDKGYLKITFGSGESAGQKSSITEACDFSKAQLTRMIRNNFLGKLPSAGWTMYVLYRVGGGATSNVAKGAIRSFSYLNCEIAKNAQTNEEKQLINTIKNSITVVNTIPSVSGKDAPSSEEVRAMIKYNNASQERCITLTDYHDRILKMPPKYGCPYRISVAEENNKIMIYLLGMDNEGHLTETLPDLLTTNMQNYLAMYRTMNDYVEIKSGRLINLSFEADVYIDKNYNSSDVVTNIINVIKEYMAISKHQLGEDIYVGDIEKEVSKTDGVINLIDFRVYNEYGDGYSSTRITQETLDILDGEDENGEDTRTRIDLDASDYVLNSDSDTMFEIKYPEADIRIRVKTR